MKERVIIAMSGGVDSSTAAAILKKQGYDVIGVYILGWLGTPDFPCPWQYEESDARGVAKQLGIPFHTINLSDEYKKEVVDSFIDGYKKGITPNPDVLCNKEIKFKALWDEVRQFEPDYLATGHYAKMKNQGKSDATIFKGDDPDKDQSYFLWGIDRKILPKIMFPIGDLKKSEVRKLAREYKLQTAEKKDSQGICFIGKLNVNDFLGKYIKDKSGIAILEDGRQIAKHKGARFYTIGQRLASGSVDWAGDVPPFFVIAKDIKNNILVVGPDSSTYSEEFVAGNLNWLADVPDEFDSLVKIRYRQQDVLAKVTIVNNEAIVKMKEPVRAVTEGQSVVFYGKNGQLLGGGVILKVPSQEKILKIINGKKITTSAKTE